MTEQQLPPTYDPEVSPAEFADKPLLKPAEVETVWNSDNPKQTMTEFITRIIREKGSEWNRHSPYESRWEKAECELIGEYSLQALVFLRDAAKIQDAYTLGSLVNTFFDLLIAFDKGDESLRVQERAKLLSDALKQLFAQKRLSKDQVKVVFDYAQRTTFRHVALIQLCFSKKRVFVERPVIVTLAEPRIMGNLQV